MMKKIVMGMLFLVVGCGTPEGEIDPIDDADPVIEGNLYDSGDVGEIDLTKADALTGARAWAVSNDTSSSQVWAVTRQWSDKVNVSYSPYFTAADNISWSEAFRIFVEKLEATTAVGEYRTYKITNPQGKTLPSPVLECAEQGIFLRVVFSSWFGLPFFMEAVDGKKVTLAAGHFGVRTATGVYSNFPEFKTKYTDSTATATVANWPKDAKLRTFKLGGDDDQSDVLGIKGATFGTYMDEIHANKRVGYFMRLLLLYFGSVNLVDPANTFHKKVVAIRPGDLMMERWQRVGIGHTLIVKTAVTLPSGKIRAELASGSMPRRQAYWEASYLSRNYFTSDYFGGPSKTDDGLQTLSQLGGGLRSWRTPVKSGTVWVNSVPADSTTAFINANDTVAIGKRVAEFEAILDQADVGVLKQEYLAALTRARTSQREHPASCTTREKRDKLVDELRTIYSIQGIEEKTAAEVYSYEDYIFPALAYAKSKTCCWNTTTAAMGDIAIKYNKAQDKLSNQCRPITTMTIENHGKFKAYAASIGRAAEWREWSEDEPCSQRTFTQDTIGGNAQIQAEYYCDVRPVLKDK